MSYTGRVGRVTLEVQIGIVGILFKYRHLVLIMLSKDISYTQARANLTDTLNDVEDNRSIVVIRRRGRPGVALIAEDELTSLMETVHLLKSPTNAKRLFEALDEVQSGDFEVADSIHELAEELGLEQEA